MYVLLLMEGHGFLASLDELEEMLDEWEAVGFDEETEQYIYPEEQK